MLRRRGIECGQVTSLGLCRRRRRVYHVSEILRTIAMISAAGMSKPEEAHLLRAGLLAGGVAACVQEQYRVPVEWLVSNAVPGMNAGLPCGDGGQLRRRGQILNSTFPIGNK